MMDMGCDPHATARPNDSPEFDWIEKASVTPCHHSKALVWGRGPGGGGDRRASRQPERGMADATLRLRSRI